MKHVFFALLITITFSLNAMQSTQSTTVSDDETDLDPCIRVFPYKQSIIAEITQGYTPIRGTITTTVTKHNGNFYETAMHKATLHPFVYSDDGTLIEMSYQVPWTPNRELVTHLMNKIVDFEADALQ